MLALRNCIHVTETLDVPQQMKSHYGQIWSGEDRGGVDGGRAAVATTADCKGL